jgi:2-polyprenyl-6-methoxyphenol hydroxylase-like FAD-dependent oxidoreductase
MSDQTGLDFSMLRSVHVTVHGERAVVIGGSIAGLAAARVLSDHFSDVLVVERDGLPEEPGPRRGVPQSVHLHGLTLGGRQALDEIYGNKGFTSSMRAAGAAYFDFYKHQAVLLPEGWLRRAPSDVKAVYGSRACMEHVIRTLTRQIKSIGFRTGQATGLQASADSKRVNGVCLLGADGKEAVLEAELVVDATGRGSKSPKWFEDLGYEPPSESIVEPFLGYASVYCTIPEDAWPGDVRAVGAPPSRPGFTRGGYVIPQENGLSVVMAAGTNRDYPPGDKDRFTEFLFTANTPVFYHIWRAAEQVTEIRTTRTSTNRLRHWQDLSARPGAFLAIGDAVAAFNPVYGQGITTAALQAKALQRRLQEDSRVGEVVDRFPQDAMDLTAFAWTSSTLGDLQFPRTEVKNAEAAAPSPEEMFYLKQLRLLATENAYVAQQYFDAISFMRPDWLSTPELRRLAMERANGPQDPVADVSTPPPWADAEPPKVPASV